MPRPPKDEVHLFRYLGSPPHLYLHDSLLFKEENLVGYESEADKSGVPAQREMYRGFVLDDTKFPNNYDPLRPFVGHWRQSKNGIWFDNLNEGSLEWWEGPLTKEEIRWIEEGGMTPDFTPPGTTILPTPRQYPFYPSKAFRLLADRTFETSKTTPSEKWQKALNLFSPDIFSEDPTFPGLQNFRSAVMVAVDSDETLPHYHTGYVDDKGRGFTTGMLVHPDYEELANWLIDNWDTTEDDDQLSTEFLNRAFPIYHTHVVSSVKTPGVGVGYSSPRLSNPEHSDILEAYSDLPIEFNAEGEPLEGNKGIGLYKNLSSSKVWKGTPRSDIVPVAYNNPFKKNNPPNTGTDPGKDENCPATMPECDELINVDTVANSAINEPPYKTMKLGVHEMDVFLDSAENLVGTIFLELLQLRYNNKELGRVLYLGQNRNKMGDPYVDPDPSNPLHYGKILPAEAVDQAAFSKQMMSRHRVKQQLLKYHLFDKYVSRMHNLPIKQINSFRDESSYKVFKDNVFHIQGMPMDLGYRESIYNYTIEDYEEALNLLGTQQHHLIPNPYILGQTDEDQNRLTDTAKTLSNPIYKQLITLGDEEITAKVIEESPDQYLKMWTEAVHENIVGETFELQDVYSGAANIEIFGFPKYEFIKKYNPPYDWGYPWLARLVINTPKTYDSALKQSEFPDKRGTFINDAFLGDYDKYTQSLKSDEIMLFFMARVAEKDASTELSTSATEYSGKYYRRKLSKQAEEMDIEVFDFTDFTVGNYEESDEFDMQTNSMISFDLGTEEQMGLSTQTTVEEAFMDFRDSIEKHENTRSLFEILNADTYDSEVAGAHGYTMHPFAHSEIIFYEITKYQAESNSSDTIVQRFFIAPPHGGSKYGIIEYFDTQMKIEKGYRYDVFAYTLVVGNEYQYANIQTKGFPFISNLKTAEEEEASGGQKDDTKELICMEGNMPVKCGDTKDGENTGGTSGFISGGSAEYYTNMERVIVKSKEYLDPKYKEHIDKIPDGALVRAIDPIADIFAINRPKIELLKIPYSKFQVLYVANKPPVYPNLNIYPYKNVNNKLLFVLSQFVGHYSAPPIEILPEDKDIFIMAKSAQEKEFADTGELPEIIEFHSDQADDRYQVFRIEEHPSSWSDFATGLRKPVFAADNTRRELLSGENDFVDDIIPNKKYYYMFRTIDERGFISNPSPIYEVELIDDSGAVYLAIKIITFKSKVPKEAVKTMRKYVQIVPTLQQSNLKAPMSDNIYDAEDQIGDIRFGDLFGTKENPTRYKIRFTSKSSGKMFDLNLKFIHKHNGLSKNYFPERDLPKDPEEIIDEPKNAAKKDPPPKKKTPPKKTAKKKKTSQKKSAVTKKKKKGATKKTKDALKKAKKAKEVKEKIKDKPEKTANVDEYKTKQESADRKAKKTKKVSTTEKSAQKATKKKNWWNT